MREADLQATLVAAAGYLGWACHWTHRSDRSPKGWPDLVCWRDGRLVAMELKVGRRQATPEQAAWLERLAAVPGVEAMLVRDTDLDRVIEEVLR